MKVYGYEITPEQDAAAVSAMRGNFRAGAVETALTRSGVPDREGIIGRAADRILQRERRAGRIRTNPANKCEWISTDGMGGRA